MSKRTSNSSVTTPIVANAVQRNKSAGTVVPTNTVTTKEGLTVRARIDPALTVEDVVRQLCLNLKVKDPPVLFALRDDTDELVTNENLRKKIQAKSSLKLVNAPALEAVEVVDKMATRDEKNIKITLFSLQKYIREEQFATEFLNRDGLQELLGVINTSHGNTLAYALTAMQNLMELDHGWSNLSPSFILRVVQVLSSPRSLVNVCRPATAILKRLVELDALNAPGPIVPSSSRGPPTAAPGSVYRFGFDCVYEQTRKETRMLETVVSRLGSADTAMALYSMMLINSLLAHATETYWDEFIADLERLNVRKAVIRLMSSLTIEDLTSCILDFQANMVRVTFRKKTTLVDPDNVNQHREMLWYIWSFARLQESDDADGSVRRWRKLGFDSENMSQEFGEVGVLGLDCLKHFVERDPEFFYKVVVEQLSRPAERRCPIGKASNEIVELLAEHWAIYAPGYSTSTTFQPFFLNFLKVHALALNFFLRMWNESGASAGDFPRVVALVRSQVKVALRRENVRPWHEVEQDFISSEYRAVRDRQMKELEEEDDLLSKVPVRNLRAKLYKESYEFVRQQRIHCLQQGAWFVNAIPASANLAREGNRRPSKPWRFMRLDNSMRYLHYVESGYKFPIRSGLEDLPERLDVSFITEIGTGTGAPPPHVLPDSIDVPGVQAASPLSFSLINAHEGALANLVAIDASRWADWTDGLNMLRRDGGHVTSSETAGYVQALTEIGLKIKLLDLSGENVQIPSALTTGPPPTNLDYFFSDMSYEDYDESQPVSVR